MDKPGRVWIILASNFARESDHYTSLVSCTISVKLPIDKTLVRKWILSDIGPLFMQPARS